MLSYRAGVQSPRPYIEQALHCFCAPVQFLMHGRFEAAFAPIRGQHALEPAESVPHRALVQSDALLEQQLVQLQWIVVR